MKRRKKTREQGLGGVELAGQAFHLVRQCPRGLLLWYAVGTCPFLLVLLFFWADLTRGRITTGTIPLQCLLLTATFLWMKLCQTEYMGRMYCWLSEKSPPVLSWRRFINMLVQQSILQPPGLVLIPVSLLVTLPFAWVYAFFQNATLLGNGEDPSVWKTVSESARRCRDWPGQNHMMIWLTSPVLLIVAVVTLYLMMSLMQAADVFTENEGMLFLYVLILWMVAFLAPMAVAVALNLVLVLAFLPHFLKMFLGVETILTLSGENLMNSTLILSALALTYLLLDPVLKAAYVLRYYYGASLTTGQDLADRLAQAKKPWVGLLLAGLLIPLSAAPLTAAPESPDSPAVLTGPPVTTLDQAIDRTLQKREYNWRFPREVVKTNDGDSFLDHFFRSVSETLESWFEPVATMVKNLKKWLQERIENLLRDWFKDSHSPRQDSASPMDWMAGIQIMAFLLLTAVCCVVGLIVFRMLRQRNRRAVAPVQAVASAIPDLNDENLLASQLPEDRWLELAADMLDRGDYRLSMRALYLATLSMMETRQWLSLARYKSNRDYLLELNRRTRHHPDISEQFAIQIRLFERVWYGRTPADERTLAEIRTTNERIRSHAA
ncbi:MAG: DUF4129 domain-containing protein [Verrucomicrobiae bacterium]|nr:DUF4129 domain-containing protein [Verrucomicrobiae bacterium]